MVANLGIRRQSNESPRISDGSSASSNPPSAMPRMTDRAPADPPRGRKRTAAVLSTVAEAPAQSTMTETTSTHQQGAQSLPPAPPINGKVVYHPTNTPASATIDSGMINKSAEPPRGLVKDKRRQNRDPLQVIENMHNARIGSDKRQPKRRRLD